MAVTGAEPADTPRGGRLTPEDDGHGGGRHDEGEGAGVGRCEPHSAERARLPPAAGVDGIAHLSPPSDRHDEDGVDHVEGDGGAAADPTRSLDGTGAEATRRQNRADLLDEQRETA